MGDPNAFRILLVDDDIDVVACLRDFLEEVPGAFKVVMAHSGDEAFLRLVDFKPDVIVLDVGLPDTSGLEILNPIQDIHPNAHIVMLTGNATPELREAALRQGAVRFLEKPLELLGFRRLLQELGTKSRTREANALEGGMDILDLVQMMFLCQKSAAVRFTFGRRRATLRFERGELVYIDDGSISGDKAFFNMVLLWGEGRFYTVSDETALLLERNTWMSTDRMLMEAALLRDHASVEGPGIAEPIPAAAASASPQVGPAPGAPTQSLPEATAIPEAPKGDMKALLGQLMGAEGTRAALVVDWDGKVIEGRAKSGVLALETLGAVISASLGSTQVIGRELRVGGGNLVVLEFEKGNLLARVLGSHGVLAVLVDSDANLGMHRYNVMRLASEIENIL
jgi:CheY-like chemotaxis protein/predicted regulator of Ras-like GTPase activity (Roadblock/LC7/MglB family)